MKMPHESLRPSGRMIIREYRMPTKEIFKLLADVSHSTYIVQRHRSKGDPIESIPKAVSEEDETRAMAAWWALLDGKPSTREEAVNLVKESSHQVWLGGQKKPEGMKDEDYKQPDPEPNLHDQERAEHLIQALQDGGIIEFR